MQVFHAEDNSRVEGRCGKANTAHLVQTTTGSDKAVWHEKDKESATLRGMHSKTCDLVCSGAWRRRTEAKEGQRTPPDPELPNWVSRSAAAQQCSMEKLRHTEAVDTARDGLSQRRKELRQ